MKPNKRIDGMAILIGAKKPPKDSYEPDAEDEESEDPGIDAEGKRSALKDLFRALKSDDIDRGVTALDNYLSCSGLCPDDDEESEPDESEDSEDEATPSWRRK